MHFRIFFFIIFCFSAHERVVSYEFATMCVPIAMHSPSSNVWESSVNVHIAFCMRFHRIWRTEIHGWRIFSGNTKFHGGSIFSSNAKSTLKIWFELTILLSIQTFAEILASCYKHIEYYCQPLLDYRGSTSCVQLEAYVIIINKKNSEMKWRVTWPIFGTRLSIIHF